MKTINSIKAQINNDGFAIVDNIYSNTEIDFLLDKISQIDSSSPTCRKTVDLFAIRQFFIEVPEAVSIIFNNELIKLISDLFGQDFFVVKSIYFDKPENSNWFVAYHQDLTISVDKKIEIDGFGPWTKKQDQFAVQPPSKILEDNFTIRIHLDDTAEANGALKVIPASHVTGICRPETIDKKLADERTCNVKKGGIMIMKPLLLHSSNRTTNQNKRRVIHVEFSRSTLPANLNWSELLQIPTIENTGVPNLNHSLNEAFYPA
jgi:ectoine hydroxylase-related dioxygenase (phytanoyl-CoA dioxygenase family)